MKKMRVALIGYGRSGWGIHGAFFKKEDNDICDVVAVVEYDPARQAAAKADFGCDTYSDYKELFQRDDIDLVVSACYSNEHYAVALDLLNHGYNVLSEKPLCKTPQLAQELMDAARKNNAVFTVFHQYRYNDYYIKMKELLEQGIIGDLKLIRTSQNSFARRYDWQTLLYREGGAMRNNLAHSIEQVMDLAGSDELPEIHSKLAIWNSVGDAEDYVHISMEYANGLLCELECNPADAYNDSPVFYLYGTRGTMKVFPNRILVKYYLDGESPAPALEHKSLHNENGDPAYCSYSIVWHEEEITFQADMWNAFGKITNRFYHDLYDHIFNGGELFMKPEHVKAQVAIMCEVERQNPLESKFDKPQ